MFDINITTDDYKNNEFLFCLSKFGKIPNRLTIQNSYNIESLDKLEIKNNINIDSELIPSLDDYIENDRVFCLLSDNIFLSYIILNKQSEAPILSDICFYYKDEDNINYISSILNDIEKFSVIPGIENNNQEYGLNIIGVQNGTLSLSNINTNVDDFEIYYSKFTVNKIKSFLKNITKDNGISVFYGEVGTGKTEFIKYLPGLLNKNVFFIPNTVIEHTLLNPEFINFLTNYQDSVLVIDDFEIFMDSNRSLSIINSITQLTDSLISNLIKVNIILISNTNLSDIEDIFISNNFIDFIEFTKLNKDEAEELSKKIGKNRKYKNNHCVSDIIKGVSSKEKKRIGL